MTDHQLTVYVTLLGFRYDLSIYGDHNRQVIAENAISLVDHSIIKIVNFPCSSVPRPGDVIHYELTADVTRLALAAAPVSLPKTCSPSLYYGSDLRTYKLLMSRFRYSDLCLLFERTIHENT